jgi:hypothetical protein
MNPTVLQQLVNLADEVLDNRTARRDLQTYSCLGVLSIVAILHMSTTV